MPAPPRRPGHEERDPAYRPTSRFPPPPADPRYSSPYMTRRFHESDVYNHATGERVQYQYYEFMGSCSSNGDVNSAVQRNCYPSNSGRRPVQANPSQLYENGDNLRSQAQASASYSQSYPPRYENTHVSETFQRDMSIAQHRQSTFDQLWDLRHEFHDTHLLVDSGFYCIGQGDAVECFHCHAVVANWSWNDNPHERHRQMSPGCRFLLDGGSLNQPPSPQRPGHVPPIRSFSMPHQRSQSVAGSYHEHHYEYPSVDPPRYEDHDWSAPISQYTRLENQSSYPNSQQNSTAPNQSGGIAPQLGPSTLQYVGPPNRDDSAQYPNVSTRDSSISMQREGRQSPRYYGRTQSDPHSARQHQGVQSQPALQRMHSDQPLPSRNRDNWETEHPRPHPANPSMTDPHVREATFRPPFERYSRLNASIREIAEAGFYYTGEMDCLRCFHCGGLLDSLAPGDNIWEEHAKFFPQCRFMRQQREPHFVDAIVSSEQRPTSGSLSGPCHSNEDRERIFHSGMASQAVRAARDAGYAYHNIRQVQWTHVCIRGTCYQSAEDLLHALRDDCLHQDQLNGTSDATQPCHDTHLGSVSRNDMDQFETHGAYADNMPMGRYSDIQYDRPVYHGEERVPNATDSHSHELNLRPGPSARNGPGGQASSNGRSYFGDDNMQATSSNENQPENRTEFGPAEQKRLETLEREKLCKICLNDECSMVFVPCGHFCSCESCAQRIANCCVCRAEIHQKFRRNRT